MNKKEHEERLQRMLEDMKRMESSTIRPLRIVGERDIEPAQPSFGGQGEKKKAKKKKVDKLITKEEVERQIRANYPEQAKYWLGNGRGKHTEITLTVKCAKCNSQGTITIEDKSELRELLKEGCLRCKTWEEIKNQHLKIPLPFGKFRGKSINYVMEKQPSYLAWFVDKVKGEDALVEKIKTHTGFPAAWADYVGKQAVIVPKTRREEQEWQEGRFSQQTIDELFNCFFGGGSNDNT
jgi:uncharacterized protein (DUF3820 family)